MIEIVLRDGCELKMNSANNSIGDMLVIVQANEILGHIFTAETSRHPTRAPKGRLQSQIALRTERDNAKQKFEPRACQFA
jgi:hypothetical protein